MTSVIMVMAMLFSLLGFSIGTQVFATVTVTWNSISGSNNGYVNLTNSGSYPVNLTFSGILDTWDIVELDVLSWTTVIQSYTWSNDLSWSIVFDTNLSTWFSSWTIIFSWSVYTSGWIIPYVKDITATGTVDFVIPTAIVSYTQSGSFINATLTGSSEPITVTNNTGSLIKTFNTNGDFTFNFIDEAGNTGSTVATVSSFGTANQAPVNLLSSSNFVLLSKTAITDIPNSVITGNIWASPISGTAIGVTCVEVTGNIYSVDAAGPDCKITNSTLLTTAVSDMEAAYTDAAGRTIPTATELGAGNIWWMTLAPWLYKWGNDVTILTDLILEWSSTWVWIFQIAGNLDIASATKVLLSWWANASNIFWQVWWVNWATLNTTSTFNWTILSAKQIILRTGAILNWRALSQTQIVLDQNIITVPVNSIPNPFTFSELTWKELNTTYTSTTTVTWVNTWTTVSIIGGQYKIWIGSYTSSSWTVNNWDLITVMLTSTNNYSTPSSLTLDIGWVSSIFKVTTKNAPSTWGWGGGGTGWTAVDYCPNWDTSPSYYDNECTSITTTTSSWITTVVEKTSTWTITTITSNTWTTTIITPKFLDIENSFAKDAINSLVAKWIIVWYPDWTFRPESSTSRAEFLGMTMKAFNIPVNPYATTNYTDIPSDWAWIIKYVEKARELGIAYGQIIGWKLKFRPNDSITRAEAIAILLNVAKITIWDVTVTDFIDIPAEWDWMIKYIEKAKELGIANGQTIDWQLKFRPNDSITRAETATIVFNALNLMK